MKVAKVYALVLEKIDTKGEELDKEVHTSSRNRKELLFESPSKYCLDDLFTDWRTVVQYQ